LARAVFKNYIVKLFQRLFYITKTGGGKKEKVFKLTGAVKRKGQKYIRLQLIRALPEK